jgi:hypothetical protein
MERGDLVVVGVGDDDRLRRVGVVDGAYVIGGRAPTANALQVVGAVGTDGRHHDRIAPELAQAVRNVAGTAAEFAAQGRHEERDVQDVQLLGQDLLRELARERGDGVERQGTADQRRHAISERVRGKKLRP